MYFFTPNTLQRGFHEEAFSMVKAQGDRSVLISGKILGGSFIILTTGGIL